jgi:hypothetical protein
MKDSLAPFKGVNAIPCPLGMDIEYLEPIDYPKNGSCVAPMPVRPDV